MGASQWPQRSKLAEEVRVRHVVCRSLLAVGGLENYCSYFLDGYQAGRHRPAGAGRGVFRFRRVALSRGFVKRSQQVMERIAPMLNVLFSSAGRRVELMRAFRKAYGALALAGQIICVDA